MARLYRREEQQTQKHTAEIHTGLFSIQRLWFKWACRCLLQFFSAPAIYLKDKDVSANAVVPGKTLHAAPALFFSAFSFFLFFFLFTSFVCWMPPGSCLVVWSCFYDDFPVDVGTTHHPCKCISTILWYYELKTSSFLLLFYSLRVWKMQTSLTAFCWNVNTEQPTTNAVYFLLYVLPCVCFLLFLLLSVILNYRIILKYELSARSLSLIIIQMKLAVILSCKAKGFNSCLLKAWSRQTDRQVDRYNKAGTTRRRQSWAT